MSGHLECDHCGDVAIEADSRGLFWDGTGDACMSCGFPGYASVDEQDCDGDCPEDGECSCGRAEWVGSDDQSAKCNRPDCEECRPPPA